MISNGFHFCDHCGAHLPDVDLEVEKQDRLLDECEMVIAEAHERFQSLLGPQHSFFTTLDELLVELHRRKATDDRNS